MPSFKHKTNKKILLNENSIVTIDSKHKEINQNFNDIKNNHLPELRSKKKKLNLLLENDKIQLDKKAQIKDEINEINKELKKSKKDKKEYYLNNSKYIFDYFEDKKNIGVSCETISNVNTLNNFFGVKNEVVLENQKEKINNVKKYFTNLSDSFLHIDDYTFPDANCSFCKSGELIPVDDEGIMVCNNCYRNVPFVIESEKSSYKEPPKEVCFYAYKRINHFREILAQFQAKETTQIPEIVVDEIKNQIKKERVELKNLSNSKAKEILKKLGHNKYYEHIPFIKDIIGIKPPIMTPELEDTLCNLFMEIQAPYAKYCPDDRVNFLNYYYTVYKLCELLNQKQFLPFFPMLKDREKKMEQDVIWKKICNELDWEFIPTI
jgi:hypothetical protein